MKARAIALKLDLNYRVVQLGFLVVLMALVYGRI